MKLKILFFFLIYLTSNSLFASSIRVVNLEYILDQNDVFIDFYSKIENDQSIHRKKFIEAEESLQSQLKKIEEIKLILEQVELEKEINKYNLKLNNFNIEIDKFNKHYENQINISKNKILQNILEILKKYSLDNQIDLILDSNNYILSSNSIDITEIILDELNKTNIEITFEKYK